MKTPYENEDPLRKRRLITKTKTPTKTKTHYENEDSLRKRRPIAKTKTPYIYHRMHVMSLLLNLVLALKQSH